jgi:hypothetical protein
VTHDRSGSDGRRLKLALIGTFLSATWLSTRPALERRRGIVGPMQLAKLGIATYRIGHMLAYERVATPIRRPFTQTIRDSSGAGETVVARGRGPRWVLGELLSCPICAGTWAAAALYIGLAVAPRLTGGLLDILTPTGIAEVLDEGVERLTWQAREARTRTGEEMEEMRRAAG